VIEHHHQDGRLLRRDVYDNAGRRLLIDLGHRPNKLAVRFSRGSKGRLRAVERKRGRVKEAAAWDKPVPWVTRAEFAMIPEVTARGDVLLLLGAPHRHSVDVDRTTGLRQTSDDYSEDCWLNEPSTIIYDAADVYRTSHAQCICGFCVDATQVTPSADADGWDIHWIGDSWIRLVTALGPIDVTADHNVMTPDGPRLAGKLAVGDVVSTEAGGATVLLAAERLPDIGLRPGANVRTPSGVFAAGGLLFESETSAECMAPR
jgi:hypothetical protein